MAAVTDTDTSLLRGPYPPRYTAGSVSSRFRVCLSRARSDLADCVYSLRDLGLPSPHPPACAPSARARLDGTLGVTGDDVSTLLGELDCVRCAAPSAMRGGVGCSAFRRSQILSCWRHHALRAPIMGCSPPSRHSYRPRTIRSTVAAPMAMARFRPPPRARFPRSTYAVVVHTADPALRDQLRQDS